MTMSKPDNNAHPINTVLFDLDGTLVDTAPDLATTLNLLLQENNRAPLPYDQIRPVVSNGAMALVQLGFGDLYRADDTTAIEPLRQRFLEIYSQNLCQATRLFPGMAELLNQIEQQGLLWGVITNKPARFTEPLLKALGIAARAACIISGDSARRRKPHPEPMLMACELIGVESATCVYVGDAERDIAAGLGVGMQTLVARFGYISTDVNPDQWQAHAIIDSPQAIMTWVELYNQDIASERPNQQIDNTTQSNQ